MSDTDLSLAQRAGLPEALRVLLKDYPREAWEQHPQFSGLVSFWLERHMMFREILQRLTEQTEAVLDRNAPPDRFAMQLSHLGGALVSGLHGHHQIEDAHYFPVLQEMDTRLIRGFEILDHDHHDLDGLLTRFTDAANDVLRREDDAARREASAGFRGELAGLERMLDRHLQDEEDIIVPVILKHGGGGLV